MKDALGRSIDYLRLSVTDRCDLRCIYCMPESGVHLVDHSDILSVDETVRAVKVIRDAAGIRKVRITGGEPLVRRGLVSIIEGITALDIPELTLTTNGLLLGDQAEELAGAGIHRVNVSLDSLRDDRLATISRRSLHLADIESSIRSAVDAGLSPVKVNCVVLRGRNEDEISDMLLWSGRTGVTVRFIEHMPSILTGESLVSLNGILERASMLGEIQRLPDDGSTAARYYIPGRGLEFGIIAPFSEHMCDSCSRVRLTAEGTLVPCLAVGTGPSLRDMMRDGASDEMMNTVIRSLIFGKPAVHEGCAGVSMWKIGG